MAAYPAALAIEYKAVLSTISLAFSGFQSLPPQQQKLTNETRLNISSIPMPL
jgi:hypothetical protein